MSVHCEGCALTERVKTDEVIEAEKVLAIEYKKEKQILAEAFENQRRRVKREKKKERKRLNNQKRHVSRKFNSYSSIMLRMILKIDTETKLNPDEKAELTNKFRELSDYFNSKLREFKKANK